MTPFSLKDFIGQLERRYILKAMEVGKSKAEAARLLGLNRTTLVEKMRKYDLLKNYPSESTTFKNRRLSK